jgi:transcription antitermination factor NusG
MQNYSAQTFPKEPGSLVTAMSCGNANAHWYAAYTLSHHEKRVAELLVGREIDSFVPLYTAVHRWRNGCAKNLELPLFPNYVFVHIAARARGAVLNVPGVLSLVSFGGTPAALPEPQIEALRSGIGKRKLEPHPYLVVGKRVRIHSGAMSGLEGVLIRKKNHFRVVLSLDVLQQSVAVEVNAVDVEPAPKPLAGGRSRLCPLVCEAGRPRAM